VTVRNAVQPHALRAEIVQLSADWIGTNESAAERASPPTLWIGYYNTDRPHSALAGKTPDEVIERNDAWTFFANDQNRIASITTRSWATVIL
jgi:hypothetical protein